MKRVILTSFCLAIAIAGFGQTLSKGKIRMAVEKIYLNGEEAPAQMASTLGNIQLEIISDGFRQKTAMSMMMMNTVTFFDSRTDSLKMFMDLMGKKYLVEDSRSGMQKGDTLGGSRKPEVKIVEHRDDVKEILGYPCYRVDVAMKAPVDGGDAKSEANIEMKLYVTDKLKFDGSYVTQGKEAIPLKGTPLEYTMRMGGGSFAMEMLMVAKEIGSEVPADAFNPPSGNYKVYTMQAFQEEMGQMKR
ncbi:MAG: hypothetical protein IT266_10690 [Saprospiraceae bacterium]|nr:hypothetical protein [Saprospiraceae bacterium]